MIKHLFAFLFSVSTLSLINAQGYKIDFVVEGLPDTTLLLGNFFGESTYVKDTAVSDSKGNFTFQGDKELEQGVYFLVLNKVRLLDILIGEDQQFEIKTQHSDYLQNMEVSGDVDNTLFLEYRKFNLAQSAKAKPLLEILRDSTATEKQKTEAKATFQNMGDEVESEINRIITSNPETVTSKLLAANRKIEIPQAPDSAEESWRYKYFLAHFWDDFDLGDPTMLRMPTPIYDNKVDEYFDKLIVPSPDSVINAIDRLASVAKSSTETYRYLIWKLTIKYQEVKLMGFDKVFVHIYDKYYATGDMDFWANDQLKKNIKEEADKFRNSLLGMVAHNMIMLDDNLQRQALHDIKSKYTIVYFYDPDCGHCKKETPELKKFFDSTSFDVGVFTVSADTSISKMKTYIANMEMESWINVNGPRTYTGNYQNKYDAFTTPTLYLLNERKEIIAKKIKSAQLEEFLKGYEQSKSLGTADLEK
ncbi:MAG: DUF5106 domain-containing protein [Cyclobacteriaceae bacterium]